MLTTVFQPSTPIRELDHLAGRKREAQDVVDAINQRGHHVMLYGDRGVGKTSFANTLAQRLTWAGGNVLAPMVNCVSGDSFASIWGRVFESIREIQDTDEQLELPSSAMAILESCSGPSGLLPDTDTILRMLTHCGKENLVVVNIDEFDCVEQDQARQSMADMIKYMSDRGTPATINIVGVGDDVTDLFESHNSIERCISQIKLPRMNRVEVEEIIDNGFGKLDMSIVPGAKYTIWQLCKGLPHFVHLLALYAGRRSLDRCCLSVDSQDVDAALKDAIGKTEQSIQKDYTDAITSSRPDALYKQVLTACAMVQTDDLGFFYPGQVRQPLEKILGREYKIESFARHLNSFCEQSRSCILAKDTKTARPRFRFQKTIMQPYVLIRAVAEKLIEKPASFDGDAEPGSLF